MLGWSRRGKPLLTKWPKFFSLFPRKNRKRYNRCLLNNNRSFSLRKLKRRRVKRNMILGTRKRFKVKIIRREKGTIKEIKEKTRKEEGKERKKEGEEGYFFPKEEI